MEESLQDRMMCALEWSRNFGMTPDEPDTLFGCPIVESESDGENTWDGKIVLGDWSCWCGDDNNNEGKGK